MFVIIQSIIVGVQVGVSVRTQEHVRQVVSMATLTGNLYFSPATCYARFDRLMIACQEVYLKKWNLVKWWQLIDIKCKSCIIIKGVDTKTFNNNHSNIIRCYYLLIKIVKTKNENILKIYLILGHSRCRGVCFFTEADLEKCSFTSLLTNRSSALNGCHQHVFISCLDSHFDGTHTLQRIHWWASDIMLNFSKSVPIKKQTALHLGWSEGEYIFSKLSFLTILLMCKIHIDPLIVDELEFQFSWNSLEF